MGLNNIELSPYLLTRLYSNNLFSSTPANDEQAAQNQAAIPHTGKGLKQILIVFSDEDHKELDKEQLSFLQQMLKACKLTFDDITLINHHLYKEYNHEEIIRMFNGNKLLLFGLSTLDFGLPFNIPQFQVQSMNNRTVLYAAALKELQGDKLLKSKLWSALKQIFQL